MKVENTGYFKQSMEIMSSNIDKDDKGNKVIKDFRFFSLTLLGNSKTPCFENARIELGKNKFDAH